MELAMNKNEKICFVQHKMPSKNINHTCTSGELTLAAEYATTTTPDVQNSLTKDSENNTFTHDSHVMENETLEPNNHKLFLNKHEHGKPSMIPKTTDKPVDNLGGKNIHDVPENPSPEKQGINSEEQRRKSLSKFLELRQSVRAQNCRPALSKSVKEDQKIYQTAIDRLADNSNQEALTEKSETLVNKSVVNAIPESDFITKQAMQSNRFTDTEDTELMDESCQTPDCLLDSLAGQKTWRSKLKNFKLKRIGRRKSTGDVLRPTSKVLARASSVIHLQDSVGMPGNEIQDNLLHTNKETLDHNDIGNIDDPVCELCGNNDKRKVGEDSCPRCSNMNPYQDYKLNNTACPTVLKSSSAVTFSKEYLPDNISKSQQFCLDKQHIINGDDFIKDSDIVRIDQLGNDISMPYQKKVSSDDEEPLPGIFATKDQSASDPPSSSCRVVLASNKTFRKRWKKVAHYCKVFLAFLFSHVGLCLLVVAYAILGGFIFQALEDKAERNVRRTVQDHRERVVHKIVTLAVQLGQTERGLTNFTDEVDQVLQEFQRFIHTAAKDAGWDGKEGEDEESLWTFASSLLFAITVTTTIGYGHVAPKTPVGRLVTIVYALVGIPLTLLFLTNIGDVMAKGFRLLYGKVCCGLCCQLCRFQRGEDSEDVETGLVGSTQPSGREDFSAQDEVIQVPTSLSILLIAAYILAGALLFSAWQGWDVLTGSYFCFITLSTIGFGDIVPGVDSNSLAAQEKLVLCALYLVLGLSLIAMCFNLVQEDVRMKCRWIGIKLGIVEKPGRAACVP